PMKQALVMKKQGQFHPLKYLTHLVKEIEKAGGKIYERTVAIDVKGEDKPTVITRNGNKVKSKYVVACSHFAFYEGMGFYFARMYPERAYVVAVKTKKEYPGGMYISSESPTRSVRYTPFGEDRLLLLSGESHKTGQGINTM